MSRTAAAITLVFAVVAASCGDGGATPTTTTAAVPATAAGDAGSFDTYTNTDYGFRVSFPSSWTVQEGAFGSVAIFLSPLGADDGFSENVNVLVEDLEDEDLSLGEYLDISLESLESVITDFVLVDDVPDTLAGVPARTLLYTGTGSGFDLRWMQTIAVYEGSAWVFTYTGERDFDVFIGDAAAIFASWELLD